MDQLTKVISVAILVIAMLMIIILLVLFIKKMLNTGNVTPTINYSRCKCMRQDDGNSGFCGMCASDGTTFGCPHGDGGCRRDCKKLRYSGKAQPNCR